MIELKSDSCSDPIGGVLDDDPLYATTLGIIVDDFAHLGHTSMRRLQQPPLLACFASIETKPLSQICFLHTCDLLALASFGSAPYSLDETSVVKCVVKAGCSVGALT